MDFPGNLWLGLYASIAEGKGSIPGLRTKIPHATGLLTPRDTTEGQRVAAKTQGSQDNEKHL